MKGETAAIEAYDCLWVEAQNKVVRHRRGCPALGPGQVRVKAEVSMISPGTELHHITGTHTKASTYPRATGYIGVGRVVGLGDGVEGYELGQRVLSAAAHNTYANQQAEKLVPVPEHVDPIDACTVVLLAISLRGIRAGKVRLGDSVAVFGQGPIGLFATHLAKVSGGYPVLGIDPLESRRALAKELGADATINPLDADAAEQIRAATGGEGPFVGIDASGTNKVMPSVVEIVAEFGRVVVLGGVHGTVPMDLYTRFQKSNLTMVGCGSAYPQDYPFTVSRNEAALMAMIGSGQIRPRPAVTHVAPWREGPEMYRMLIEEKDKAVLVALDWSDAG